MKKTKRNIASIVITIILVQCSLELSIDKIHIAYMYLLTYLCITEVLKN